MKNIISVILLSGIAAAGIEPPNPAYGRYGSYSRQLTVYENARNLENDLELRKYRRFRDEVRRTTPQVSYSIVGSNYYGRAVCGRSYGPCR